MLVLVQDGAGDAVLSVTGRFDAHEVAAVRPVLIDIVGRAAAGRSVRVDLSATDFFDSRALLELIDAREVAGLRGVTVRVAGASAPVRTVLTLAGLSPELVAA